MRPAAVSEKPVTTFLDIPAELRNAIYRLSLHRKYHDAVEVKWREKPKRRLCRRGSFYPEFPAAPGILRTCKQIYAEASSILYGELAFEMTTSNFLYTIRRIPCFAAEVRFLGLDFKRSGIIALSRPREDSAPLRKVLEALEALPKLNTLTIEGDFCLEYAQDTNIVKPVAQTIAQNLHDRIKSIMESQRGAGRKVREVLKLDFGYAGSIVDAHFYNILKQVKAMKEFIFQELESVLE